MRRELALVGVEIQPRRGDGFGAKPVADLDELAAEQRRDAGQDVDVAIADDRPDLRRGIGAVDQLGAGGNIGEAEVRVGELVLPVGADAGLEIRVSCDGGPERVGDRRDRDVVVGRADAARREHVVETCRGIAHGRRDVLEIVGNHGDPPQVHAETTKLADQKRRVLFHELSAQDLVADDDDPRGGRHVAEHIAQSW